MYIYYVSACVMNDFCHGRQVRSSIKEQRDGKIDLKYTSFWLVVFGEGID